MFSLGAGFVVEATVSGVGIFSITVRLGEAFTIVLMNIVDRDIDSSITTQRKREDRITSKG